KFKAKVAVEAIRGGRTLTQLASQYHVHPMQVGLWRKTALEQMEELFVDGRKRERSNAEVEKEALYEQIGRLKVELDWLKKKVLVCSTEQRRQMVELAHPAISMRRQCELLGVSRSGLYYQARGESRENLMLMRLIDEEYTRRPFYGSRKMMYWLNGQGWEVGRHRVRRLMGLMGLQAIYPKPRLSQPGEGHRIYPYLLNGVDITRVNQVWSTDITYIRMREGFVYLVAVMDWFSRFVLSWALSLTLELDFCQDALRRALRWGRPEIFNSDQGSQFTSDKFTAILAKRGVTISMDGRGRCMDNIFIERLWRSLKYEEVYLHDYTGVPEAQTGIGNWLHFYNHQRFHQSLQYRTPAAIFQAGRA
ncbi:MAG: IS3 family transposase, partial [Kiritimatiellia bacterium]